MQDGHIKWIAIGRGMDRSELEEVVERLEDLWEDRWDYRIEDTAEDQDGEGEFRLLVRHL